MKKTIILMGLAVFAIMISNNNEYVEIPSTSIRMRVIAKSNSEEDQKEKVIVKSALEEKLYEIIKNENDTEAIDQKINDQKDGIDNYIKEVITKNNIDASFTSNYGYNYFPEKEFKGLTYEAGNYKSFVVTLGEGKGDNFWCVLFPPLCLIDENLNDYEYHSLIKDTILKYN